MNRLLFTLVIPALFTIQYSLAQTATPCDGYNSRYLKATLSIQQPPAPTGNIPARVTISHCACLSGSGPGCQTCTANNTTATCAAARSSAQSALSAISRMDLRAQAGSLILASSSSPSSQTTLSRQYDLIWNSATQADGTYQVQSISQQASGSRVASSPAITIVIDNRQGGSANPPPSVECRDNIEISVFSGTDASSASAQYFSDGRQGICFNPQTRYLYSANCRDGNCPAYSRVPENQLFQRIAREAGGASPAAALCDLMGGALRDIKFNWTIGSNAREIKITQCFFDDPVNVSANGSFFGAGAYWNLEYERYLQRIGTIGASPAAAAAPLVATTCPEGAANCIVPNVCQNGTTPKSCYFLQSEASCIATDERFHDCKLIRSASDATFPPGTYMHTFMDRTFPSGRNAECWARVMLGCQGTPNQYDRWFGPRPSSNYCVQAIRDRNVAQCQSCQNDCMARCLNQTSGACTQEYEGVGDNCGVCQYRCQRSYEGCTAR